MARKVADCRDMPSEVSCTLTISGEEDEVVAAATQHAVGRARPHRQPGAAGADPRHAQGGGSRLTADDTAVPSSPRERRRGGCVRCGLPEVTAPGPAATADLRVA